MNNNTDNTEGFSEPHSGIEKPRSFIDVTELRSVKSTNDEDVNIMIGIRNKLESSPLAMDTTRNDDPNDKQHFRRCLRSVAYRKILKEVSAYLFTHCKHDFVEDSIDIDPDRSQTIKYCHKCMITFDK